MPTIQNNARLIQRINNLPKEIDQDLPNLGSLATGLATSIASSYLAGGMASDAPRDVKIALIPIIASYASLLGAATSLIVDKLSKKVFSDIENDINSGKIKPD